MEKIDEGKIGVETQINTPDASQEAFVSEKGIEPPFSEQISNIDSQIGMYSSGAENDAEKINELRTQMGLGDTTEEAPSVLAQKEEAQKLEEQKAEMEEQQNKKGDLEESIKNQRTWSNLSGEVGAGIPGILGGTHESYIICGLCGQKGHGRAECPNNVGKNES